MFNFINRIDRIERSLGGPDGPAPVVASYSWPGGSRRVIGGRVMAHNEPMPAGAIVVTINGPAAPESYDRTATG